MVFLDDNVRLYCLLPGQSHNFGRSGGGLKRCPAILSQTFPSGAQAGEGELISNACLLSTARWIVFAHEDNDYWVNSEAWMDELRGRWAKSTCRCWKLRGAFLINNVTTCGHLSRRLIVALPQRGSPSQLSQTSRGHQHEACFARWSNNLSGTLANGLSSTKVSIRPESR
jgi:hypothetical protein